MALYADVSGKQFPVTRGQDVGRYQVRDTASRVVGEMVQSRVRDQRFKHCSWWYCASTSRVIPHVSAMPAPYQTPNQVSWSLEHKSAHAGTYEVRFFDEESYSLLRKVSIIWNSSEAPRREGMPHF
jgi:translocon-associated protein subunit delta